MRFIDIVAVVMGISLAMGFAAVLRTVNSRPPERCINGHVYYVSVQLFGESIAPKLDDEGKPVKCLERK